MRNGQNKRMRGRNRGKGGGGGHHHHHHQNPLSRMYESNGPDLKIRGNASHIAEKYLQLARDAQSSGDPIAAENYYQHAEHYFRLIAAAQEHLRQTQPSFYQQQPQQGGNDSDDSFDDGDNDQPPMSGEPFAPQQQSYYPREQQQPQHHQQPQQYQQPQQQQPQQHYQPRQQNFQPTHDEDVERLPSFITGGQPQPSPQQGQGPQGPNAPNGPNGQNNQPGQNGYDGSPDRFPLHRRRRRHRGPRDHSMSNEGDAPMPPGGPQSED
jgi:Domain of unknown function (DUF4167)